MMLLASISTLLLMDSLVLKCQLVHRLAFLRRHQQIRLRTRLSIHQQIRLRTRLSIHQRIPLRTHLSIHQQIRLQRSHAAGGMCGSSGGTMNLTVEDANGDTLTPHAAVHPTPVRCLMPTLYSVAVDPVVLLTITAVPAATVRTATVTITVNDGLGNSIGDNYGHRWHKH